MVELKNKVDELALHNEYQLRLKDMNYSEKIKVKVHLYLCKSWTALTAAALTDRHVHTTRLSVNFLPPTTKTLLLLWPNVRPGNHRKVYSRPGAEQEQI